MLLLGEVAYFSHESPSLFSLRAETGVQPLCILLCFFKAAKLHVELSKVDQGLGGLVGIKRFLSLQVESEALGGGLLLSYGDVELGQLVKGDSFLVLDSLRLLVALLGFVQSAELLIAITHGVPHPGVVRSAGEG